MKIFKSFTLSDIDSIVKEAEGAGGDGALVGEILESFLDGGFDVSYCLQSGCLLVKIFDNGYNFFAFPYEISDLADCFSAIDFIVDYASREEIIPIFCDVPCDMVEEYFSRYFGYEAQLEDEEGETVRVILKNQCSALESRIPYFSAGDMSLGALYDTDIESYARLLRDEDARRYWGYNVFEDYPDATDLQLLELAFAEVDEGVALNFAIRKGGALIGEATVYSFDYTGGAEWAIRLLSEHRGRGYSRPAIELLFAACRRIGLTRLRAEVYEENTPSVRLCESLMSADSSNDGIVRFTKIL